MPRSIARAGIKIVTGAGLCLLLLAAATVTQPAGWAVSGNDAVHGTGTHWSRTATPQSASKQNLLGA